MAKYKIEFDRETCIGALSCNAVNPDFWIKAEDSKVDLKNATFNPATKKFELIIEEADYQKNFASAEVCPVTAIKITKIED